MVRLLRRYAMPATAIAVAAGVFFPEWDILTVRNDSVAGVTYGAVIAFASLLSAVQLGLLGLFTAIDQRPIIAEVRKAGMYGQLMNLAVAPLCCMFAAAVLAIVAVASPATAPAAIWRGSAVACLSIGSAGLVGTLQLVFLLKSILMGSLVPSTPLKRPSSTPVARGAAPAAEAGR